MLMFPNISATPWVAPPPVNYMNYFRPNKSGSWVSCREDFHVATSKRAPGYYYGASSPLAVATMFDWVENTLNVKPIFRTQLYFTQKDTKQPLEEYVPGTGRVIYIQLGDWWRTEDIRFYLSSVLCRVSHEAAWSHPLEGLLNVKYTASTRRATGRFLDGYTVWGGTNSATNWVQTLRAMNYADQLERPSTSKELGFLIEENIFPDLTPEEKWRIAVWVRSTETANMAGIESFSF